MRMKFQKPTARQMEIKKGDSVLHSRLGVGYIIQEWGAWSYCRECYAPFHECSHKGMPARISGEGIFDVKFLGNPETRSINRIWLQPL